MQEKLILSVLPGEIPLSKLNLAGTHDSATAFVSLSKFARCQNKTIPEQLQMGVRFLDIRLYEDRKGLRLVHAFADCYRGENTKKHLYFDEVFSFCTSFLKENPRETLVLSVKLDRGSREIEFAERFYKDFIKPNADLWYLENCVPTLRECRGKLVLFRRYIQSPDLPLPCGLDFSVWESQKSRTETVPLPIVMAPGCTALVQDRYRLAPDKKWNDCAKPFLDICKPTESRICLHYLSTCGGKGVPAENAAQINEWFSAYSLKTDAPQGWILLDFPTQALCDKIMQSNLTVYSEREMV